MTETRAHTSDGRTGPPARQTIGDHGDMTVISRYHEVQEVMRTSGFWPSMFGRFSKPLLDGSLMSLPTEEHLTRRRAEVVMFSRSQLMEYELEITVPALRRHLLEALDGGDSKIDIMDVMRSALLQVTAKIIGLDLPDSAADIDELRVMAERFGDAAAAEWLVSGAAEVVEEALTARDRFDVRYFQPALARRRRLIATNEAGSTNDLLTLLLRTFPDMDTDQLRREAVFYVNAAANTTSHLAPHVLLDLMEYFKGNPEHRGLAADLGFLQRAVSEALRLHPTVPALMRMALDDIELSTGRTVAKGEQLLLDLNASGRDESVYGPTAHLYDPFRTLPPRTPPYGLAFGDGAHTCLGRQVAVGAGNGSVSRDDLPAGVLTRLLREVLRFDPHVDPDDPPVYRPNTMTRRFSAFPVVLHRPSSSPEK
ncbi:cytochrome P450 [Pseudonocardia ailaonensis]|uniref:Cytochrome P450 n=1 Tax=Pseudonocardia ailaonensis TaxID=367279 RepID=A0ABN2N4B8_9PSEU